MAAATRYRTFTENDEHNRDAWIKSRVENDCEGCVEFDHGEGWRPAEGCAVHGVDSDEWWHELNAELDTRWPGTWHDENEETN